MLPILRHWCKNPRFGFIFASAIHSVKPFCVLLRCNNKTFMMKLKTIGRIIALVGVVLLAGFVYSTFFRPVYGSEQNVLSLILFGLVIGGLLVFLILRLQAKKQTETGMKTTSHTVVESIRRVFKIVVAEGQLNEIYNYENTKKLLKFIPSTKKALVVVRAKVLVGYDIEKCRWEVDEAGKKISLLEFPKPEILSIDPDFNYYYFEDDLFNFIGRKDLQEIQDLAKQQVRNTALQSGLVKTAAEQMKLLLTEIATANQWQIENTSLIDNYAYLPEPEEENPQIGKTEASSTPSLTKTMWNKAVKFLKNKKRGTEF